MIAIETRKLSKRYHRLALDQLDLKVKQGEVYGFIGRNGAGKTTTIHLLLSMIHATEGEIFIHGKPVSFADPTYKQDIGYVPDVPVFPNYMNAVEYLTYASELCCVPTSSIPKRVSDVLDFVDLHDHKKRIGAYSRGMKQRLAIAQALVHEPSIIIMDEPTSALDPIGRKDVINIILKLKGTTTIFYSTHILEDVEKVCDRIGLLEQGRLILEATMEEIQAKYYQNEMLITTEEPLEDVFEFLKSQSLDNDVRLDSRGLVCRVRGETTAHDVLNLLLHEGYHISEFKRKNASLEDVFIEVTNANTV